jgi:hypothetical protein
MRHVVARVAARHECRRLGQIGPVGGNVRAILECRIDAENADLLLLRKAARGTGKSEIGVLRAAEIILDDVLGERAGDNAIHRIAEGCPIPCDVHAVPGAILDVSEIDDGAEQNAAVGVDEIGVIVGDIGGVFRIAEGIELDRQTVGDADHAKARAVRADRLDTTPVIVQHECHAVGAGVVVADVDLETTGRRASTDRCAFRTSRCRPCHWRSASA